MKMFKRIIAGTMVAVIGLLATACSDTTWAYKQGDINVTSGMYLAMVANAYDSARSQLEDSTANVFTQKIEEKDGSVWINDKIKESVDLYIAIERQFADLKLELTEEENTAINTQVNSSWEQGKDYYTENGIGKDSFTKIVANATKTQKVFEAIYGAKGSSEVKNAELKPFYYENFAAVKFIAIPLANAETGAPLEEKEVKAADKKAAGYLKRIKNGENIEKLIKENYLESIPKDQRKEAEKQIPADNLTIMQKEDANYPVGLVEKVFKAKAGAKQTVTADQFIFVFEKLDIKKFDKTQFKNYRATALSQFKGEDFLADMKAFAETLKIESNAASIARYVAKNIKDVTSQA